MKQKITVSFKTFTLTMNNEPCTVVLTFDSVEENVWSVTIQINLFWQYLYQVVFVFYHFRACLHGGGVPQIGEVTCLGGVARLSI